MSKKKQKTAKRTHLPPVPLKREGKRLPRQTIIPGVGDEKIAAIENAALDYAEIRDARQELNQQEVTLKTKLIDLMHAKKLTEYKRNGISVKLQVESETVKVRVKSQDEEVRVVNLNPMAEEVLASPELQNPE